MWPPRLFLVICLIACVGLPGAQARDAVHWTAPGWYLIWWVKDDVAYDLLKGPYRSEAACNAALAKMKRRHSESRTLECRHLTTAPP